MGIEFKRWRIIGQRKKRSSIKEKGRQVHGYLPKDLAEESMFPFREADSTFVKVNFKLGDTKLVIEKMTELEQPEP